MSRRLSCLGDPSKLPLPQREGRGEGESELPLPQREGRGEGESELPLPLGEGWGEGPPQAKERQLPPKDSGYPTEYPLPAYNAGKPLSYPLGLNGWPSAKHARLRDMPPEEQARENIDRLLEQAGWVVQNSDSINLYAGSWDRGA